MVQHNWIETKLIEAEHARNQKHWSKKQERQFKQLLKIYHTGSFKQKSRKDIRNLLQ